MKFICDIGKNGVRILRCFGYDGQVELPEKIHGLDVTELGAYAFAGTVRRQEAGVKYLAELREVLPGGICGDGQREDKQDSRGVDEEQNQREVLVWDWEECAQELLSDETLADGTPAVRGNGLTAVFLPESLERIGAYAFYLCERLERISLYSSVRDLGAGLFTGCCGVKSLKLRMVPGARSCLKEVLAELKQTLRVDVLDMEGRVTAKLLFPEYFEESIENTPARILTQEMHGCGHRYRNAFSGTELQYAVYDKLFAHIQVQESAGLVTELVLGRLMYPVQLSEERKRVYEEYAAGHGREAVNAALISGDMGILRFVGQAEWCTDECMKDMLSQAGERRDAQATGVLMELRRRRGGEGRDREGSGREGNCLGERSDKNRSGKNRNDENRSDENGQGKDAVGEAGNGRLNKRRRRFEL